MSSRATRVPQAAARRPRSEDRELVASLVLVPSHPGNRRMYIGTTDESCYLGGKSETVFTNPDYSGMRVISRKRPMFKLYLALDLSSRFPRTPSGEDRKLTALSEPRTATLESVANLHNCNADVSRTKKIEPIHRQVILVWHRKRGTSNRQAILDWTVDGLR